MPCESWLNENGEDGGGDGPPTNEEVTVFFPFLADDEDVDGVEEVGRNV